LQLEAQAYLLVAHGLAVDWHVMCIYLSIIRVFPYTSACIYYKGWGWASGRGRRRGRGREWGGNGEGREDEGGGKGR
jgi:hypothetical protein